MCHRSYNHRIIQDERTSGPHTFEQGSIDILYMVSLKLHWQVLWPVSQPKESLNCNNKAKGWFILRQCALKLSVLSFSLQIGSVHDVPVADSSPWLLNHFREPQ